MSHIFDALQRSEGEETGADLSAELEAPDVLRRAERRAALKWEEEALVKQATLTNGAERMSSPGAEVEALDDTAEAAAAINEPASTDESSDIFSKFQSLEVFLVPEKRLVCLTDTESLAAEAFRLLAVRLRHLRRDRPLRKMLITSTIPQEGKSMVAANLACTLAIRTHQRVLLLEGDVRRPTFSQLFGLGRNPGLCECLQGERTLETSIYRLEAAGLWILPAGSAPSNALELLQSGKLSSMMDQLAGWFEWIIIDSPPILPLADTSVWTRLADGVLLVAREGTTEKRRLKRGLEAVEPRKLIGALLNCAKNSADSSYYYRKSNEPVPDDRSKQ
jgi:capsular exopolysaccharide synthesis family protein